MENKAKVVSRKTYNWSIKPIKESEVNKNQWPFRVIRDEGKATKQVCRSMSTLKESFNNTTYNIKDCARVLSRYSAIIKALQDKYKVNIGEITHLYLTYDSVYFRTKDKDYVRGGLYDSYLLKTVEIQRYQQGFDIVAGISENEIVQIFQAYNTTKSLAMQNNLKEKVQGYISARKNMVQLDNNKSIIELFDCKESLFTGLKYLFLNLERTEKHIDYKECIQVSLQNRAYKDNAMLREFNKIVGLQEEEQSLQQYVSKLQNTPNIQGLRNLRKIYTVTSGDVKNLFTNCDTKEEKGCIYVSNLSKKELQKINEEIAKLQYKKDSKTEEVQKCKVMYLKVFMEIVELINRGTNMLVTGLELIQAGNPNEYVTWTDMFEIETISKYIQQEYDYKRGNNKSQFATTEMVSIEILREVAQKIDTTLEYEIPEIFIKTLPTYLKDNRKTAKSLNLEFSDEQVAKETVNKIKNSYLHLVHYMETFLGIQYAILFGIYMSRWGVNTVGAGVALMPNITDTKIVYTKNVLDVAERCLYAYKQAKANIVVEYGINTLKEYESYCSSVIGVINGEMTQPLVHTIDGKVNKQVQIENLKLVLAYMEVVYGVYKIYFKI